MTDDIRISELHFGRLSSSDSQLNYSERPDWIAQCEKCDGTVVFDRASFPLTRSCPKCGERYYRALCTEGDHYILISNDTLLEISDGMARLCPYPDCDFVLMAFSHPNPVVLYEALNIVSWEEDQRRKDFRSRAHQRIPEGHIVSHQLPREHLPFFPIRVSTPARPQDDRRRFEEYHFTTGARLKQAEYFLLHIYKEYGRFSAEKSVLGEGLPEFIRHDLMLRGFILSLRSALDVLCQEILLYYLVSIPERRVDFDKDVVTNSLPASVADLIRQFRSEGDYVYLNRLRNVLEHRRASVLRKKVQTSVLIYPSGGVQNQPHPDEQLLADDPESPPGTETIERQRSLCLVGRNLLIAVNDFILRVYEAAN